MVQWWIIGRLKVDKVYLGSNTSRGDYQLLSVIISCFLNILNLKPANNQLREKKA